MLVSYLEAAAAIGTAALATDAEFQRKVAAADKFVKTYCGRQFERATFTHVMAGHGAPMLYLPEPNVVSLTEVKVDTSGLFTDVAPEDLAYYVCDGEVGMLHNTRGYFPRALRCVRVIYVAGWLADEIPADLKDVVLRLVAKLHATTGEQMQSESMGDYSYTRQPDSATSGFADASIRSTLDFYKRW